MSLKNFFLVVAFAAGLTVVFPEPTEATWMTCDTNVRTAFVSTSGWDQETAWDRQTSDGNAYNCAAVSMGYPPSQYQCYRSFEDPANPFISLNTWFNPGNDVRPLVPPAVSSSVSIVPYTQTTWNSCALFCSDIENSQYCSGEGGMCNALKLKAGRTPSSVSTKSIPLSRQGGTFGTGYGVVSSGYGAEAFQAGSCTPRPPTVTLTATPASVNQGGSSLLSWNSFNVDSCTGVGFNTGGATSGSVSVTPGTTTTYTINCTGGAGPVSANATVTVIGQTPPSPPTGLQAVCSPSGDSVTLSWSQTAGATNYFVRMDDPANNAPACTDGWFCGDPPDKKTDSYVGTSIPYPVVPNRAYNWWVHAANANGVGNPTNGGFTCSGAALPDLTPNGISPTGTSAGVATTITATIRNQGSVVANASNVSVRIPGTKADLHRSYPVTAAIQPNTTRTVTFQATFPSEGMYQVEICSDWYSLVSESNEGNNCATYDIAVNDVPVSNGVSCDVSPRNVNIGGTVTYTATPSGGAGAPYSWSSAQGGGPFGSSSTVTRTFSSVGTKQMEVSASGASSTAVCPVVNVTQCPGTRTAEITATPNRVNPNGTATLNWSASAINTTCTITGPGVNQTVSASSCTVPDGSLVTPALTTQSTYTISCDSGAVTDTAIVNVTPVFEEF